MGVDVVSPADVWAVGVHAGIDELGGPTLTEHWNGKQWRVVASPSVGKSELLAVSAAGPRDVWAVGTQRVVIATSSSGGSEVKEPSGRALVEHWDGSSWKIVPIASPAGSLLNGVAALSARDVWVVGASGNRTEAQRTFLAHWNGKSWTRAFRAEAATKGSYAGRALKDVVALSTRDVWAVGEVKVAEPGPPLVMHWNGKEWMITPAPRLGGGDLGMGLYSVSAVSPKDVWSVGNYGGGIDNTFIIDNWDGSRWRAVPGDPNVAENSDEAGLFAVAGAAADGVWAVGGWDSNEHWDGKHWKGYELTPGFDPDWLNDVAAVAPNDFWAVGVQKTSNDLYAGGQALIGHYGCG
jgi:hypothetical protein